LQKCGYCDFLSVAESFLVDRPTADQHLAFGQKFGPVETDRTLDPKATPSRFTGAFADISNLAADGKIWGENSRQRMYKAGNKLWHTDSSFKFRPGLCSLLYSRTVAPVGGHTEFADQRAAYDALPDATKKKLQGLVAEHSIATSRKKSGFTDFNADEAKRSNNRRKRRRQSRPSKGSKPSKPTWAKLMPPPEPDTVMRPTSSKVQNVNT
jgi:alpha-ketoglutarate-dependent taurine dioxygenase